MVDEGILPPTPPQISAGESLGEQLKKKEEDKKSIFSKLFSKKEKKSEAVSKAEKDIGPPIDPDLAELRAKLDIPIEEESKQPKEPIDDSILDSIADEPKDPSKDTVLPDSMDDVFTGFDEFRRLPDKDQDFKPEEEKSDVPDTKEPPLPEEPAPMAEDIDFSEPADDFSQQSIAQAKPIEKKKEVKKAKTKTKGKKKTSKKNVWIEADTTSSNKDSGWADFNHKEEVKVAEEKEKAPEEHFDDLEKEKSDLQNELFDATGETISEPPEPQSNMPMPPPPPPPEPEKKGVLHKLKKAIKPKKIDLPPPPIKEHEIPEPPKPDVAVQDLIPKDYSEDIKKVLNESYDMPFDPNVERDLEVALDDIQKLKRELAKKKRALTQGENKLALERKKFDNVVNKNVRAKYAKKNKELNARYNKKFKELTLRFNKKMKELVKRNKRLNITINEKVKKELAIKLANQKELLARKTALRDKKIAEYDQLKAQYDEELATFNKDKKAASKLLKQAETIKAMKEEADKLKLVCDQKVKEAGRKKAEFTRLSKKLSLRLEAERALEKEVKHDEKMLSKVGTEVMDLETDVKRRYVLLKEREKALEKQAKQLLIDQHKLERDENKYEEKLTKFEERKKQVSHDYAESKRIARKMASAEKKLEKKKEAIEEKGFEVYLNEKLKQLSPHKDVPLDKAHLPKDKHSKFEEMVRLCRDLLENGKIEDAKAMYLDMKQLFVISELEGAEKANIYNAIRELYDDINLAIIAKGLA